MKQFKAIVVFVLFISSIVSAQREEHPDRRHHWFKDLTIEQLATLQTKEMTLALGPSEKQQKEMYKLHVKYITFRRTEIEKRKTTKASEEDRNVNAENRYKKKLEILDRKIAQQEEIKKIITPLQFNLWKEQQLHRKRKLMDRKQRRNRQG